MTRSPEITVSIVESNIALGASLHRVIENSSNLRMVGRWSTGAEALEKIVELRPQVILMAMNLPDISGIEVTARIKWHLAEIEIIMITEYRDHDKISAALRAGASSYLHKRSSATEVRAAISDVMIGEIARPIKNVIPYSAPSGAAGLDLSKREIEVMERLSQGLKNKEIGMLLGVSAETVRVHLRRIYLKINVSSRTQAVIKFRNSCNPGNWASQG